MFRCGLCSQISVPRDKATRVVTETREVTYPYRANANTFMKEGKEEVSADPGGKGLEIAKEVLACKACTTDVK